MLPHAPLKLRSGTSTELGLRGFIDFCLAPLFGPSLHHGNWSGSQLGFSSRPELESFCSLQKHICSMSEGEIVGVYVLICVKQEHLILNKYWKWKSLQISGNFAALLNFSGCCPGFVTSLLGWASCCRNHQSSHMQTSPLSTRRENKPTLLVKFAAF